MKWLGFGGLGLAIDPGGACLGWALFEDGVLVDVGLSRTKEKDVGARARYHALTVKRLGPDRVVSESMRFRARKRGIPPQDLIELNLIAGHVAREWLCPEEWKGSVPKEIHQPRILKALTPKEIEVLDSVKPPSLKHNAIDAVGIGLYCLGRLKNEQGDRNAISVGKPPFCKSVGGKRRRPSPRAGGADASTYPRTRPSRSRG